MVGCLLLQIVNLRWNGRCRSLTCLLWFATTLCRFMCTFCRFILFSGLLAFVELGVFIYKASKLLSESPMIVRNNIKNQLFLFPFSAVKLGKKYTPPQLIQGKCTRQIDGMCRSFDSNDRFSVSDIAYLFGTTLLETIRIYMGRKSKHFHLFDSVKWLCFGRKSSLGVFFFIGVFSAQVRSVDTVGKWLYRRCWSSHACAASAIWSSFKPKKLIWKSFCVPWNCCYSQRNYSMQQYLHLPHAVPEPTPNIWSSALTFSLPCKRLPNKSIFSGLLFSMSSSSLLSSLFCFSFFDSMFFFLLESCRPCDTVNGW